MSSLLGSIEEYSIMSNIKTLSELLNELHCIDCNVTLAEKDRIEAITEIQTLVESAIPARKQVLSVIELEEIYRMNEGNVSRFEIYEAVANRVYIYNEALDTITANLRKVGLLPTQEEEEK